MSTRSWITTYTLYVVWRRSVDNIFFAFVLIDHIFLFFVIQAIGNSENINEMDGACAVAEAIVVNVKKIGDSLSRDCSVCKQVQKECNEWRGKYKDMKKMFVELTVSYAELDLKYKHLSKSACGKNGALSEASTANENVESADIFTPAELKFLEYMPLDKTADSTFVLQCLKYLYKDDPKSLAEKTLFGTKDSIKFTNDGAEVHHPGKQAVTPTKARRIKALFVERVVKCGMNSAEFKERIHEPYVHKLIASGIKNMSK